MIAIAMHCAAIQWPLIPLPKGWYFNAASTEWAVGDEQHAKIRESGDGRGFLEPRNAPPRSKHR